MTLGDKIRSLRAVEGSLRGLGRPMTQLELIRAMKREVGRGLSQAYLSQIESGSRPHLTQATRDLQSELRASDAKIDRWLYAGVERFPSDPELSEALLQIAEVPDSRHSLLLLAEILRAPGLAERLTEVLKPNATQEPVAMPQTSST